MNEDDKISTYVVPLMTSQSSEKGEWQMDQFLGSAFFVGREGHLLTAAHVLPTDTTSVAVMSAEGTTWVGYRVTAVERRPAEDVALLATEGVNRESFLVVSAEAEYGGAHYMQFSYPEDVAHELVSGGRSRLRPDLVFTEGHVRRRMTDIPVPAVKGSRLYELGAIAGAGSSGSPVILKTPARQLNYGIGWPVIGVYVGERV